MVTQQLLQNYPKKEQQVDYIVHPVQKKNGKWVGAEVLIGDGGGYIRVEDNPIKCEFETEQACQTACNIHNRFIGFSDDDARDIVSVSMGLKKITDFPK